MVSRRHSTTVFLTTLAFALVLAASVAMFVLLGRHMRAAGIIDISTVMIAAAAALFGSVRGVSWPIAPAAGFACGLVGLGFFSMLAWFAPGALFLICAALAQTLLDRSWARALANLVGFFAGALAAALLLLLFFHLSDTHISWPPLLALRQIRP